MPFTHLVSTESLRTFIKQNSASIENARFLCVVLMTYVHLHFPQPNMWDDSISAAIRLVFMEVLGRSSVPLLSVISGILIVPFYAKRTWAGGVRDRAERLIVPMIIVNGLALALFGLPSGSLLNALTGIAGTPALIYMEFLRDLFVLCALSPALIYLIKKAPWLVAIFGFGYYVANVETLLIFRPQIAGFFLMGLFIALRGPVRLPAAIVIAAFIIVIGLEVTMRPDAELYDLLVRRPVTAAAFWVIATRAKGIPRFGKSIFIFFLIHGILYKAIYFFLAKGFLGGGNVALWLVVPWLCFGIVVISYSVWQRIAEPHMQRIFSLLRP